MGPSDPMHLQHVERLLAHISDETIAWFLAMSATHLELCPDDISYEKLTHSNKPSFLTQLHNPAEEKS